MTDNTDNKNTQFIGEKILFVLCSGNVYKSGCKENAGCSGQS